MTETADLIFVGGTVVTVDPSQPEVEALAVKGERILAVGSERDMLQTRGSDTELVDLGGRTLMPGFIEPHGHPLWSAQIHGAPVVDIRAVTVPTFDAAMAKIKRRVTKAELGEYLFFFGLDPALHLGMRYPTREELDALSPDNPLAIQTANCHVVIANSLAMEKAGISERSPTPAGGHAQLDGGGRLTGKFEEGTAWHICESFYDEGGDERTQREFNEWIWKFARAGITTGTEILFQPYYLPFYQKLMAAGGFPLRIRGYEPANRDGHTVLPPGSGDDRFAVSGIKVIADGSPFAGNIWVSRPYLNTAVTLKGMGLPENNTGHMNFSNEELRRFIEVYGAEGWQLAIHTQGDRTIDTVLDLYEQWFQEHPIDDHRYRLEHCAMMSDAQIDRAVALGVTCSYFMPHIYHWGEVLRDEIFGPEVAVRYMPIGSATRAGMRLSYHCDPPMTDPNPLLCLQLAVTRKTRRGNVIGKDQRVDIDSAIRAVTLDAAYQLHMDNRIGSLEAGKYADLVELDSNPRTTDPDGIAGIAIRETYLCGKPTGLAA